jgi:O-antigen ligase
VAVLAGLAVGKGQWELAVALIGAIALLGAALSSPEVTVLVVIALVPWSVYPAASGRFSIFLAVPVVGLVASVMLLARGELHAEMRRRMPVVPYIVLVAVAMATALLSSDPTTGLSRVLYLALFGLLAYGLATAVLAGRMSREALIRAVVYGAALAGIAVIVQALWGIGAGRVRAEDWLDSVFPLFGGQRAAGENIRNFYVDNVGVTRGVFPFMAAPSAGQYMAIALVGAAGLRQLTAGDRARRGLDVLAFVVIAGALIFTFSRQSWLGAIVGLLALNFARGKLRGLPIIAGAVLMAGFLPSPGGSGTLGEYLLQSKDTSTTSSGTRLGLWQEGVDLIPGHALKGVGPGLYSTLNPDPENPVYYAHNVFLDVAVELGIAGAAAFILVVLWSVRAALARGAAIGFAMLATFVVANLFDDTLYFPRNGLLVAAAFALAAVGDRPPVSGQMARRTSPG